MLKLIAGFLHQRVTAEKKTYWSELIGSPLSFSLERRIFHSICIGLVAVAVIYVPYNLYARLYVGSLSALILSLIFFFQYYYSRFHNIQHSNILFGLTGILIFAINYFTNSGIHGSTDLVWPAYLLLVFAITPYRQHVRWLILYLLAFLIVHVMEYKFPYMVQYPFNIGKGQFTDRITAFPITVLAIYIIIKYIRRSYDNERALTDEKSDALRISNEQILL
jgi:two-component system sensor histidine kinase/response regulator